MTKKVILVYVLIFDKQVNLANQFFSNKQVILANHNNFV